jgi:hypothetical protein
MQKLCIKDPSGKGIHCFCIDVDTRSGIKKCCKCNQWNGIFKVQTGLKILILGRFLYTASEIGRNSPRPF